VVVVAAAETSQRTDFFSSSEILNSNMRKYAAQETRRNRTYSIGLSDDDGASREPCVSSSMVLKYGCDHRTEKLNQYAAEHILQNRTDYNGNSHDNGDSMESFVSNSMILNSGCDHFIHELEEDGATKKVTTSWLQHRRNKFAILKSQARSSLLHFVWRPVQNASCVPFSLQTCLCRWAPGEHH
jgi:hypothetical protein